MERNTELKDLKRDLEALRRDVSQLVGKGVEKGEELFEEEVEDAREKMMHLMSKARHYGEMGREKAKLAADKTQAYAEENPWQVAAVAGAVGLLLGFLIRKSRD